MERKGNGFGIRPRMDSNTGQHEEYLTLSTKTMHLQNTKTSMWSQQEVFFFITKPLFNTADKVQCYLWHSVLYECTVI